MRGKLLYIVTLLVFATLSTTTGRAGPTVMVVPAAIATQETTGSSNVEPLADGTKNPASIPDEVALRVMLLNIADPSDTNRLRAKFGRMKLQESDMVILVQKVGSIHGLVTAQRARIKTASEARQEISSKVTFADVALLDRELVTLAANAYGELLGSLSPEGATKLREHLAYIKTRIKVFPPGKMAASHH